MVIDDYSNRPLRCQPFYTQISLFLIRFITTDIQQTNAIHNTINGY